MREWSPAREALTDFFTDAVVRPAVGFRAVTGVRAGSVSSQSTTECPGALSPALSSPTALAIIPGVAITPLRTPIAFGMRAFDFIPVPIHLATRVLFPFVTFRHKESQPPIHRR